MSTQSLPHITATSFFTAVQTNLIWITTTKGGNFSYLFFSSIHTPFGCKHLKYQEKDKAPWKKFQSLRGVTEDLLNLCPEENLTIFFLLLSLLYWAANKSALCLGRWCYFYIPRLFSTLEKNALKIHFWNYCCCLVICVRLFAAPWTTACQAPMSSTISESLLKLICIESVLLSQ